MTPMLSGPYPEPDFGAEWFVLFAKINQNDVGALDQAINCARALFLSYLNLRGLDVIFS